MKISIEYWNPSEVEDLEQADGEEDFNRILKPATVKVLQVTQLYAEKISIEYWNYNQAPRCGCTHVGRVGEDFNRILKQRWEVS